jgi:UDP-N-acetylglucosamine:LPS N-acetylglucosamine transferase
MKILLVSSTGGHLAQLLPLQPWLAEHDTHWVTFKLPDGEAALADHDVTWAYHPTTRNVGNLIRNSFLAWKVMRRFRPDVLVSTGAAVAFPFFVLARVMKVRSVFIEVYDRIDSPTLTGRLVAPFADLFALQWDEQQSMYPHGVVIGHLL